ncbi:MAG: archaemetzincin family Zn-dependent metalloprotease [Salinivirgaceae bacterium]|nr:archaemetzincin family Zn-dependent metalloprotease [Salinivirgaceae bacterium]
MNQQSILLINKGNFKSDILNSIAQEITCKLNYPVHIVENSLDLDEYYDPVRRQFNGNDLLKTINSRSSHGIIKKIGLFRVDLFIPILTYIFGQAQFKGSCAIASTYRLRNELYGIKKDDTLLLQRFTKVIIHELGHTFGLTHCHTPTCVMRSTTYVEDIDQKEMSYCPTCKTLIEA